MKRNYWPLFFIGIFSFVFGMIVWTIMSATKTPVHEDETFLKSYHDLDKDFNGIVESNKRFLSKYDFKIKINEKELPLIFNDMFLSQRALEEKSQHKNIFNHDGNNKVIITVRDKSTQALVDNVNISFRIARPTGSEHTLDFTTEKFTVDENGYELNVDLPVQGNWNATGTFQIGSDIGYFFIKSNAN